jgi:ADP-heptose:LPS heptosyltransferase
MRMHTVEQNLLLLEQSLNIVRRDAHLELYTGPEEERRMTAWVRRNGLMEKDWVTLHTGGRYWFKRWSSAKWARLADVIQGEMGVRVVFVGGAGEAETVREIASWMKTSPLTLVGETTVLELAAFLRKSLLLVGNDSGPMHMASAVGTPVIALFGPTDPAVWRPWGKGHVVLSRQVSCSPCGRLTCDLGPENCMEQISFDEVLQAVCQCLEKPVPPPSTVRSNH